MNRRLVRAGLLLSILVLAVLETLALASVARTANPSLARDSDGFFQAGRLATSVISTVVGRKVARLVTDVTADAAIGAVRWAAANLGSEEVAAPAAHKSCGAARVMFINTVPRRPANHTI